MRTTHRYLHFGSDLKIIKAVTTILNKYSHQYKYKEYLASGIPGFEYILEFYLFEDKPGFGEIRKEINKFLTPTSIATRYEKSDIQNAEWFIIRAGEYQYPQPEDTFEYRHASFNIDNYCRRCGLGAIQNAPYRLKTAPKQPTKQFWGLHWAFEAIFVRQETRNILEKENIKGIRFLNPVIHKKNLPIEGFYQLQIDNQLAPAFDHYNTKTITCKPNNEEGLNTDENPNCCGRTKFHHPHIGGYLFTKKAFEPGLDIVQSAEYFGSGGSAHRLQIVSRRFKDLVEKNKLKGLSFETVMHTRYERGINLP